MTEFKVVRYQGNGEWSALYIDGKLDKYGDHYIVDERIAELFGVDTRWNNDDFVKPVPGTHREVAHETLEQVEQATAQREEARTEAARLRAEADELIRRAERLWSK